MILNIAALSTAAFNVLRNLLKSLNERDIVAPDRLGALERKRTFACPSGSLEWCLPARRTDAEVFELFRMVLPFPRNKLVVTELGGITNRCADYTRQLKGGRGKGGNLRGFG
jgi:hypothetical protein